MGNASDRKREMSSINRLTGPLGVSSFFIVEEISLEKMAAAVSIVPMWPRVES